MLTSLFHFSMNPWELVLRGTLMYWFLFCIFRFVTRRDVGAIGVADVLVIVLIADAAQNGMAGGYETVAEGMVLVATLCGWNVLLDWASFRFPMVRRLAQPRPLALIEDGKVLHRNRRREFVTMEELLSQLRQYGVSEPAQVRHAYMESDGSFSVILKDQPHGTPPPTSRHSAKP